MTNQDISDTENLSEKQLNAILHIIASRTMVEAAEKSGTSRNALYEWMKNPAFKLELQRQRDIVVEGALGRLELNVVKAVDNLTALLDNPNVYYKRNVALDIIAHVVKGRERSKIEQLERKVSDLEKKLSDRAGDQSKVK